MKKFLYVLVCLLLLAGVGGSAYLLKGGDQGKNSSFSVGESEEKLDSSVEDEPMDETVVKGLNIPENEEEDKW